jgi:hypothetical protein
MNVAEFLLARIQEDETTARKVGDIIAGAIEASGPFAPARVLTDLETKRRIIDAWQVAKRRWLSDDAPAEAAVAADTLDGILLLLAQPYADHPDYDFQHDPYGTVQTVVCISVDE